MNTFDPESLYKHFKNDAMQNGNAYPVEDEADGIAYFTGVTRTLMSPSNGSISKNDVLKAYNSFSSTDKTNLYNAQKQIQDCWNNAKNDAQSSSSKSYERCYFASCSVPLYEKYENLAKGDTHLKLIECLGQNSEGMTNTLSKVGQAISGRSKRIPANHGLLIEAGGGIAFGLYASGSTGVGYNLNDLGDRIATTTSCLGFKFDIAIGGGFSISYLPDWNDIEGEALTVELGADIPYTEIGIDLLLHFSIKESGQIQRFIGFGFSIGMGVGLNPIDVATSKCTTTKVADIKDSVLIAIGLYRGWICESRLVGVVTGTLNKYICCPQHHSNRPCSQFCWFDGTECPQTPAQMSTTKYALAIAYSSCPGQTYIAAGQNNWDECFRLWKMDWLQKYILYRVDSGECWFSNTYSLDRCVWAPSNGGFTVCTRPKYRERLSSNLMIEDHPCNQSS